MEAEGPEKRKISMNIKEYSKDMRDYLIENGIDALASYSFIVPPEGEKAILKEYDLRFRRKYDPELGSMDSIDGSISIDGKTMEIKNTIETGIIDKEMIEIAENYLKELVKASNETPKLQALAKFSQDVDNVITETTVSNSCPFDDVFVYHF